MVAAGQDDVRHVHDGPGGGPPEHGTGAKPGSFPAAVYETGILWTARPAHIPVVCCKVPAGSRATVMQTSRAFLMAAHVHVVRLGSGVGC